jgi:hypothetical protein
MDLSVGIACRSIEPMRRKGPLDWKALGYPGDPQRVKK